MTIGDWLVENMDRLYRYAIHLTRDQDLAEELVQEIAERVLDGRIKVNLTRYPATLIQRAMMHKYHRLLYHLDSKELPYQEGEVLNESCWATSNPYLERLHQLLPMLTDRQLQVINLMLDEGLGYRAIGTRLGLDCTTVRSYYEDAVRKLKRLAQALDGADSPDA